MKIVPAISCFSNDFVGRDSGSSYPIDDSTDPVIVLRDGHPEIIKYSHNEVVTIPTYTSGQINLDLAPWEMLLVASSMNPRMAITDSVFFDPCFYHGMNAWVKMDDLYLYVIYYQTKGTRCVTTRNEEGLALFNCDGVFRVTGSQDDFDVFDIMTS